MKVLPGGVFRSLRGFNYRVWAVGALVSNIGTWVHRTAQDWLVFTQLTHHDASAVGLAAALQFGPQLLLLPLTGFAADRLDQRRLLIATQATMGALASALGALTVVGLVQLWHVYIFAFLFGIAAAFDTPVRQTFAAELVGDEDLPNAVALNSTSSNAARMIGPAVSGVVIAAVGTGWAFVVNGASFVAMLVSLTLLRVAAFHPHPCARAAQGGFVEGLRYVLVSAQLRAILAMLFLIGTFALNFPIFISTMAVGVFHADARLYGFMSSIMALGTVAGALFSAGLKRPRLEWLLAGAGALGFGCAMAAIAPSYWPFTAALVVVGFAAMIFTNTTNSLLQLSTERAMRGQVVALGAAITLGGAAIGAPLVGWIANHWGPRWSLGAGAASGFAAALIAAYTLARDGWRPGSSR